MIKKNKNINKKIFFTKNQLISQNYLLMTLTQFKTLIQVILQEEILFKHVKLFSCINFEYINIFEINNYNIFVFILKKYNKSKLK